MNPYGENDPGQFKIYPMLAQAKKYPDIIVGFKTAHYCTNGPYDDIHTPWASVDALLEAGRAAELPVMIDMIPRPELGKYPSRSRKELILEKLRPGDIDTHCFKPHYVMLDENGKLREELFKAQERGIIFDVGHGGGSFVWRNAIPAIEQGFLPNSISTDLHSANTNGKVMNMANVMSKILSIGVSIEDVIRLSTINPAREINHPELGNLSVGAAADIAVFELLKGSYSFTDVRGGKNYGSEKIHNIMTLKDGEIVSDPYAVASLYWKDIKDKNYWVNAYGQYW